MASSSPCGPLVYAGCHMAEADDSRKCFKLGSLVQLAADADKVQALQVTNHQPNRHPRGRCKLRQSILMQIGPAEKLSCSKISIII
jgi:hypothetical protein